MAGLSATAAPARADDDEERDRPEIGVLPALGYDSDLGFGFGAAANVAIFAEGYEPYRLRFTGQVYMTARRAPDGGAELPFHDDYVQVDLPGLAGGRLRLRFRAAFARIVNAGYYGIGNGTERQPSRVDAVPRYHEYRRTYPSFDATARVSLLSTGRGRLDLVLGTSVSYNDLGAYAGSRLLEDRQGAGGEMTRALLVGARDHALVGASAGLLWDGRDDETAPSCCALVEATLRTGAGLGAGPQLPFGYGGATVGVRFYGPLHEDRLVLAARALADFAFGQPPFYELALGGATTLRGVPARRLHGRTKLLLNAELRSSIVRFRLGRERFDVGLLAFVDTGRVWADYASATALDGPSPGLAVGIGGGARLRWGETFLIRIDSAFSPTERSHGLYIDVDHVF